MSAQFPKEVSVSNIMGYLDRDRLKIKGTPTVPGTIHFAFGDGLTELCNQEDRIQL